MIVKTGAAFIELHPSIRHALDVTDSVYRGLFGKAAHAVVTSLGDSVHSPASKHYGLDGDVRARAFDLRTTTAGHTQGEIAKLKTNLQDQLGKRFQVIVEKDHIHVEYDPKEFA
jgi:hypothetical protein